MSPDQHRRPSFQFYPDDWLSDMALKRCSLAAKGLWADMMCYMHSGNPYGYLTVGGRAITVAELARMVGAPVAETRKLLTELEAAGVPSKTDDGVYVSRRMVRDERNRAARAAGGWKSLQHPNVPRPKEKNAAPEGRGEGLLEGYPSPPSFGRSPSSSSSSSREVQPSAVCAEPLRDSSPAFLTFPTVGKGPKSWVLTHAMVSEWATAYPNLDVPLQCRRALEWIKANHAKRKTARGMPAFLVGWLNRQTDRPGPAKVAPFTGRGTTGAAPSGKYDSVVEQ